MIWIKKSLTFIIFFIILQIINAQPSCHFEHYSIEDGLPQYTIMDMLQDNKGFMWFATWNGLSKFDGYKFRNFKVKPGDNYRMISNRIDQIDLDKYGRIWFNSYDGDTHCFDIVTERFWGIQKIKGYENNKSMSGTISIMPSGKVWIISSQGAICVTDSMYNVKSFTQATGFQAAKKINTVFEDKSGNSWLLTENGIFMISPEMDITHSYFFEGTAAHKKSRQPFYSAVETEKEIFFGSENGRIWKYSKSLGKFNLLQINSESEVSGFENLKNSLLLIITSNDGFFVKDLKTSIIKKIITSGPFDPVKFNIEEIYTDSKNRVWISPSNLGIFMLDVNNGITKFFQIKTIDESTNVFPPRPSVIEDIKGRLWVQPRGGGFSLYNESTGQLEPFYNDPDSKSSYFSNIVHSAFSDRQGNLWLCTRSHGLEKVVFDNEFFSTMNIDAPKGTLGNDVRAVFQDTDGYIWIGTKDNRLTIFDKNKNKIGNISVDGKLVRNSYYPGVIYCITQDNEKNIWIGIKGEGLYRLGYTGKISDWDVKTFRLNEEDLYSLSDDRVYSIFQDSKGQIWIGTYGGGLNLLKKKDDGNYYFINSRNNLKNFPVESCNRIRYITEDNNRHLCIGTTGGLLMASIDFEAPENIIFKHFTRNPGQTGSLSYNDVHGICTTKKGEIYIVTFGGGLNKVIKKDSNGYPLLFKSYTTKDGLPSDITLAIQEDKKGNLWISSESNLLKFNPEKESFETFSEINRFMKFNNFSEASTCFLSNGEMIFGFTGGLLSFRPENIRKNTFKPYISFSNFQLFNKTLEIGSKSPLKKNIDEIGRIVLKHKQNYFSIEFSALDFDEPENILYAYKLDGFDEEWNYSGKKRVASYTNLPKGEYTLRVKSTNSEGVWTDNERTLEIKIKPSFWQTPLAWFLYLILFSGFVTVCVYILMKIYKLESDVKLEKKLSELKLKFLTDVSHEIRTPLTMVTAPVEYMINDEKTPSEIKKQLETVSHNANRILRLVNQLLDFRKMQNSRLKVSETLFSDFIMDIFNNFTETAENDKTDYQFINKAPGQKVWVDRDCLEKIAMNLISNAFKYTPHGGVIKVIVFEDEKSVSLQVSDNGLGISKDKQKNLFTRFYSLNEDKSKPSTGIGLSMVKDLADKHAAKVQVDSEPGKGSTFTVSFKKGFDHFDLKVVDMIASENETDNTSKLYEQAEETNVITINNDSDNLNFKKQNKTVLVVEDDDELRNFMCTVLSDDYTILEATNGEDGIITCTEKQPDLIISDIMMPGTDGIELLKKLRDNIETSHIPIILLSAKANIESKLEGLSYGADDYITKPFSVQFIKARISNLLMQRKRLQEIYGNSLSQGYREFNPKPFQITSQDEKIMECAVKVIEDNIDNSNFTVEEFGQSVGMSRSTFYNKIKSLTGLSPVEFIRDIRLKRASQLLGTGQLLIKEVAFMTGFSDTKYFGECFKNKYGMTPMEYKNSKKDTES